MKEKTKREEDKTTTKKMYMHVCGKKRVRLDLFDESHSDERSHLTRIHSQSSST